MNTTCIICNRTCEKKTYTSVGGQTVCSIKCASNVSPNVNDECVNCGSVVWEDENYNLNGELCCCISCRDALKIKNKNLYSSSKRDDFSTPITKKKSKNSSKKKKSSYSNNNNQSSNDNNYYYQPRQNQFEISPGMQVGGTNVAMGPRDWNTNDYDMGPGDIEGNYFHGDQNYNKYGNFGGEDESEAYGDVNEKNYLDEYGPHKIIQKNESVAMDQIRQMGGKLKQNPIILRGNYLMTWIMKGESTFLSLASSLARFASFSFSAGSGCGLGCGSYHWRKRPWTYAVPPLKLIAHHWPRKSVTYTLAPYFRWPMTLSPLFGELRTFRVLPFAV